MVACVAYCLINEKSYNDEHCFEQDLVQCEGGAVFNWIITSFLLSAIAKNASMSFILFTSLYKFYTQLKKINLSFEVNKCNLAVHVIAFGLPIIAGIFYLFCIIWFNQAAMFTSSRATQEQWDVLACSYVYEVVMGTVQTLQLILITNYSVKAARAQARQNEAREQAN